MGFIDVKLKFFACAKMVVFSLSVWGAKRGEVLHIQKIIYGSPVKLCFNANGPEQK